MHYGKIKIMITESGNAERKARVIGNIFQKEIIDTHFQSVIEYQKKYRMILGYMYWTLMATTNGNQDINQNLAYIQ